MTQSPHEPTSEHVDVIGVVSVIEACRICAIDIDFVHALVIEGVFELESDNPESWQFNVTQFAVLRKATRLYQDLNVNPAGIALVLDLLERLERSTDRR